MARYLMSEFLSTVAPDYAYTLAVAPHNEMSVEPLKTQKMLYTDANTPLVLNVNNASKFLISLVWEKLVLTDAEIIMELWTDTSKADGLANSFRWTNPDDSATYTVHFATKPLLKAYALNHQSIDNIKLLVIGNYVP